MGDSMTLTNGLTLKGMFQGKEQHIKELEEENDLLRREKAQLTAENQTVLQEQAQAIKHLNQQLGLMSSEQNKHFSTVELLESVKIEKEFLQEELQIQYDNDKKQKSLIRQLEETVARLTEDKSSLNDKLNTESKLLEEERKESFTLSCLVGERDVALEQCKSELSKLNCDVDTLKHALSSKDAKLKSVLDERNRAQWKLLDVQKSQSTPPLLKKRNSISNIPVTPPRTPKNSTPNVANSISPVTITAHLTPEKDCFDPDNSAACTAVDLTTQLIPENGAPASFDMKEKHYLSLIYRLRTELAKLKKVNAEKTCAVVGGNKILPLKSAFVRKPLKSSQSSWV